MAFAGIATALSACSTSRSVPAPAVSAEPVTTQPRDTAQRATLITNAMLIDGTGTAARRASVRNVGLVHQSIRFERMAGALGRPRAEIMSPCPAAGG